MQQYILGVKTTVKNKKNLKLIRTVLGLVEHAGFIQRRTGLYIFLKLQLHYFLCCFVERP